MIKMFQIKISALCCDKQLFILLICDYIATMAFFNDYQENGG